MKQMLLLAGAFLLGGCALGMDFGKLKESCGLECQGQDRPQNKVSECGPYEYKSFDHQCVPWRTCIPGEFEAGEPTNLVDRWCDSCPKGSFSQTENAKKCTAWRECPPGEVTSRNPSATKDRECIPCEEGQFSEDDTCQAISECGEDQYQYAMPTLDEDRICLDVTECEPGSSIAFLATTHRDAYCAPCSPGEFAAEPNQRNCLPWTECNEDEEAGPLELEVDAPTDTSDRVCVESFCGDGIVDKRLNEGCDDGNDVDMDGCSNDCSPTQSTEPLSCETEADCEGVGHCEEYYLDQDLDGFAGTPFPIKFCGPPDPGWLLPDRTDCCDTDYRARPNQSDWFTTPNACGSYDYDCDGAGTTGFSEVHECVVSPSDGAFLSFPGWLESAPGCGESERYALATVGEASCAPETEARAQVCR